MQNKINYTLVAMLCFFGSIIGLNWMQSKPQKLVKTPQNVIVVYNSGGAEKVEGATVTKMGTEYELVIAARPVQIDSTGKATMAPPQLLRIPENSIKKIVWEVDNAK